MNDEDDLPVEDPPTISPNGVEHGPEMHEVLARHAKAIHAETGGTILVMAVTCDCGSMMRSTEIYGSYGEAVAGVLNWIKMHGLI